MAEKFDPSVLIHDFGSKRHWQMSAAEALVLQGVLQRIKPQLSLEIGTLHGGSLQALSRFSKAVISLDFDPNVATALQGQFPNVEYVTGRSEKVLPDLVARINADSRPLGFVLVDGDHTTKGVKTDIRNLLQLIPKQMIVIFIHDSFNPDCRKGLLQADWADCPYVHYVELDFVPGRYFHKAYDTAPARSMYSGLACAVMLPEKRTYPLEIQQTHADIQRLVAPLSCHANKSLGGLRRTLHKFRSSLAE